MGLLRPATPGFLVTLIATILLAVVVFCVPYFKSIFFLKAAFTQGNVSGWITLGTLGYCFNDGSKTSCSKPSVGYEFDPNKLLGNKLPIDIPSVVVKWLTYALVLHVVALVLAAASAVFGLLAHVREISMACCSTCISGAAAAITLLAFIFDLAFFFVAKGRINKVQGGSAVIGNAIWLTLAAWLLLFFAGCFFSVGRCCVGTRPDGPSRRKRRGIDPEDGAGKAMPGTYNENPHSDTLRLDAIKAEADRKARAAAVPKEQGLPHFEEYERRPLRHQYVDEDELYAENTGSSGATSVGLAAVPSGVVASNTGRQPSGHSNRSASTPGGGQYPGGYSGGAPGTRAVDDYYNTPATATPAPYRGASASPPIIGQSYPVGAVYGTSLAPARQPSQSYAERFAPQNTPYADPYGASQPSYVPFAQYETGRNQHDPTSNYHEATSHSSGPSYYNNVAAQQLYSPSEPSYYSRNSQQPSSPTAGPLSPPLSDAEPGPFSSSRAATHYGARVMPAPTHEPPETDAGFATHNWNAGASSSEHHMESPPEYNLFDDSGPSIPAVLASGGPRRPEKI